MAAPPLDLWPTIIARVAIPADVEQYLVQPLLAQLGIGRSEQIIPQDVRDQLIRQDGTVDQMVLAALREAATYLDVVLTEDTGCHFIEIQPVEHYAPMLHFPEIPLRVTRLWVVELAGKSCFVIQGIVELAGKSCFVIQGIQEGMVVFLAR